MLGKSDVISQNGGQEKPFWQSCYRFYSWKNPSILSLGETCQVQYITTFVTAFYRTRKVFILVAWAVLRPEQTGPILSILRFEERRINR